MKYKFIAAPLIAATSWVGASYYMATQSHDAYIRLLEELNTAKWVTLKNASYSTGLTSSLAITDVMSSTAPDATVLFKLQHEIDYSPLGVNEGSVRLGETNVRTTLVKDDTFSDSVKSLLQGFGDAEPFQINSQVGFNGITVTQLSVNPYQGEDNDGTVRFAGLNMTARVDGDLITSDGTVGEITAESAGITIQMAPGTFESELTQVEPGIYLFSGTNVMNFPSLSLTSPANGGKNVQLESITINTQDRRSGELFSNETQLQVGKIDSPLSLNSVSMESSFSNLSLDGWTQYLGTLGRIQANGAATIDDPQVMKELISAMAGVFGPGSAMDYSFMFDNDGGVAKLGYGIKVVEKSSPQFPAAGLSSLSTVRELLNALELEIKLDADSEAIDQTPLVMALMIPEVQQFVVSDGSSYKSDIRVAGIAININGNSESLEPILGTLLDERLQELF